MTTKLEPFKIGLLVPTKKDLEGIKAVTAMDIMDGFTKNFHPNGLFSIDIFGKVGEERRSRTFSYINMNIPIFHPLIYKVIVDLKEFYGEIMAGKAYATFDDKLGEFIKSTVIEGETGYAFFIKHYSKLKFEKRASASRNVYIEFLELHRSNPYIEQLVIMPAGLRDYVVDETGKPSEDEINGMYRAIMASAGAMENIHSDINPEYVDAGRYNLQIKVLELYKYIVSLLIGKRKMIQGAWMSRKVSDSTRNVITSYIPEVTTLGGEKHVSPNTTVVGIYQFMRSVMPLTVNKITNKYLRAVFTGPNTPAVLVDPKTLTKKMVDINPRIYDEWMTYEGIEKICDRFSEESMRHYPVKIGNHYLGLIYKGPDMTFKFIQDISEVPEGRDPKHVTPVTMAEFLYMCSYENAADAISYSTRYPISGYGSTYPGDVSLRSTVRSEVRTELDDQWVAFPLKAISFPINGIQFFNSMAPALSHIGRLGADFDGDQMSFYCVMTDEAKEETRKLLRSKRYYFNLDGSMAFTQDTDDIRLALKYLTVP